MSRLRDRWLLAAWLVVALPPQARTEPPRVQPEGAARTDSYGDPLAAGAIARLGTVRLRHVVRDYGSASCITFTPDGKTLISGAQAGLLAWDVATGKELGWFRDRFPTDGVAHFSQDGKVLITADGSGSIRHWDVGTGKVVRQWTQPGDIRFRGQTFLSADGSVLGAVRNFSDEVLLWEVNTGKQILNRVQKGRSWLSSAALSPDGRTLVLSGEGNRAHVIDVMTGKEIREIKGPNPAPHLKPGLNRMKTEAVYGFTFSPDGGLLAATGKDSVCTWDARTWKLRYEIKGSRGQLAFSPDGKYLACGDEGAIRLYEAASGKQARQFERHADTIAALTFSRDARTLASLEGSVISLWDVASGKRLHRFPGHDSPVTCLAFSPDGTSLASGGGRTLLIWNLAGRKPQHSFAGHYPGVLSAAYSPDSKIVATGDGYGGGATGGLDARIRLWSVTEGRLLRQFSGHLNSVESLAFSPDGHVLASAGNDARAKLWDVAAAKRLYQMRCQDGPFKTVTFSPDGKALLVAGPRRELALWRVDSGQKLRDLGAAGEESAVLQAAYLPDGKTVLSREFDSRQIGSGEALRSNVRLWDTDSGRLLRSFQIGTANPYITFSASFALSVDGKTLAGMSGDFRDPTIQLWDTASGRPVARLNGGTGVTSLAFSPDGKILASGGRDTTVLLWDVPQARLQHLWAELAGGQDDAARAIKKLAATPSEAVPFLKERLRRVAELEARASELIPNLDDDNFAVREKASRDLEDLGPEAAFALRLALQGPPSVEVRARIQKILDKMKTPEGEPRGFEPRSVWLSLAVLEEIGTPEARQVLQELAKGPAKSTLVREAKATLERLAKRRKGP